MTWSNARTAGGLTGSLSVLALALASIACHTPRQQASAGSTLRGVVRTVGTAQDQSVVLVPDGAPTQTPIPLASGAQTALLLPLSGVEVSLRGARVPGDSFAVHAFEVVAVSGSRALDGVVRQDAGGLHVCPAVARCTRLGNPPDALRGMVGARVWMTGPVDRGPNQYGVIEPPRGRTTR